ncbi:MAG: UDP-N-acetylmuramoyl-L-alanine--D-glutamate ligase [Chloroflexota bacterium]
MKFDGKRVVVIGAARQGTALSRYLAEHGAQVVLTDARSPEVLETVVEQMSDLGIEWILGEHPLTILDGADLVCPSGGVPLTIPLVVEAQRRGIPLSNDSQLFLEECACPVIGITGSAGKTTTTTLVGRMAQAGAEAGLLKTAYIGGNIGVPLINQVDQITAEDLVVLELSSFQLDLMASSPQVAAILNISPNHLDRHGSMQAYIEAKLNIFKHQHTKDFAVLSPENQDAWHLADSVKSQLFAFGFDLLADQFGAFVREQAVWMRTSAGESQVIPLEDIELRGEHNQLNVLAACAIAAAAGLPPEVIRAGIVGFTGVEHRLEFVRELDGIVYYNDSKATSPGMAITSINAFSESLVVLAGGRDKALPWNDFAETVAQRADHLVLFGEVAEMIKSALKSGEKSFTLDICKNLEDAVTAAHQRAQAGDVVLLAPGGTSFDEFSDYEARGAKFKSLVASL